MGAVMKLTIAQVQNKLESLDFSNCPKPANNKGERGQWIQALLGLPHSSDLQDLEDGELKVFTIGESIAVTQIKHCLDEIINKGICFKNSKVGLKLMGAVCICFSRDNKYLGYVLLNSDNYPEEFKQMNEDYNFISDRIRESFQNRIHLRTITGPNKLLQIRTKASKKGGQYSPLIFENVVLKDKGMAFYLCPGFGRRLIKGADF